MTNSPFVIKQINMFSGWVYNLPKNNECTICRCNLNTPSLYNQEKGIDSYVVSGVCLHSFHQECIKPWVDKNKHCPICSVQWQYNNSNQNKSEFSQKVNDSDSDLPALISMDNQIIQNKKFMNINSLDSYKDMQSNIENYMNKQQDNIISNIIYSNSNNESKKIKIIKKIIDNKIQDTKKDIFIDEDKEAKTTKEILEYIKLKIKNDDKNKIINDDKNKMINIFKKEGKKTFDLGDDEIKETKNKHKNNPEDDSDYDIVD
jgi:hypothetical protein